MMMLKSPKLQKLAVRFMPFGIVLIVGIAIMALLIVTKKEVEEDAKEPQLRIVRAVEAVPSSRQIKVISQGSVEPRVSIILQSEVSGRIVEVADGFVAGGGFKAGDVLLRIDPRDYELAVVRAEARVAEARQRQMREQAEAAQAKKEWQELGTGEPGPLVLREPQLMEAEARLKSARADLSEARLRLERTALTAPFDGRVATRNADKGQVIGAGFNAASIYATDRLEVRLPLTDRQIALLDLPLSGQVAGADGPRVSLHAIFAGAQREWSGRIVRTEGRIDQVSRVIYAVASVDGAQGDVVPLTVGLFVEARIDGRFFENVVSVPRESVRQDGTVLVVSSDNRIHFREVEVLQATRDTSFVRMDIKDGERICISPIDKPIENMRVTVAGDDLASDNTMVGEVSK